MTNEEQIKDYVSKDCQDTQKIIDKYEKENAELEQKFKNVWDENVRLVVNLRHEIESLKKENAELKERLKEHESIGNAQFWKNVWSWKTKADQLIKAKEHIRTLISCLIDWVQEGDKDYRHIAEAEQFLNSEVEK